ncbi:MAG: MerR family transcriptional regulator [Saprospirales bacterium]|jgi:DNA-binding transcriptional MerR regulator|nr:MerR family transcriptional regulator [Saprospirales bacterium]
MTKRLPLFHKYSIKDIEHLSGIKAHTIRIWEQRYGILVPERTDTNIRYYSDKELRYILNISFLNQQGLKISKIAKLSEAEIQREVISLSTNKTDYESQINALVIAMIDLDEFAFETIFTNNIQRFGFENCVIQVLYPFLEKIGMLWITGSIRPTHEHFISNLIRQKLIVNIDAHKKNLKPTAKKFLLFTPENEWHEISLLFQYYILKSRNHDVVYIGLNIPLHDIISVFHHEQPAYLVSSFSTNPTKEALKKYIHTLSSNFEKTAIILSGYQISKYVGTLPSNVVKFQTLQEFINFVDSL